MLDALIDTAVKRILAAVSDALSLRFLKKCRYNDTLHLCFACALFWHTRCFYLHLNKNIMGYGIRYQYHYTTSTQHRKC